MGYVLRCMRVFTLILLLKCAPHISAAQTIPTKGTDATLDVATWNIEWFGDDGESRGPSNDAGQMANVQAVIEQADIDLWGVQEIADAQDFETLLDALGDGYDGMLATQSGDLRVGFIYKTDLFSDVVFQHILTTSNFFFAGRPPLQITATARVVGAVRRITFIVLHMKCCSDEESYNRRTEAAQVLKDHIDDSQFDQEPVVILGDFNDGLTQSIHARQTSPYDIFLQDTNNYFFPSLRLEQAGQGTFCNNDSCTITGSILDHILISDELIPVYEIDSAAPFDELATNIGSYAVTTSDHLPVLARFHLGVEVAVETEETPMTLIEPAYPNPFFHRATLTYTLPRAADVRVEVFDLLGRRVRFLADGFRNAGVHRTTFDAGDLPSGLYLIRFSAGGVVDMQRVVRVR